MFWADNAQKTIFKSFLDGSEVTPLVTDSIEDLSAITVWPAKNRLYYADIAQKRIVGCNLEGKECLTLVKGDMETPVRLLVDTLQGILYWSDDALHKIERCSADDGSGRQVFYHGNDEEYPFGLFIDHLSGHLYWTDYGTDQVMRTSLNGFEGVTLVSSGLADPVAVTMLPSDEGQRPEDRMSGLQLENIAPAVAVFPNPSNQKVTLMAVSGMHQLETVSIFDGAGKLVMRVPINERTTIIDTGLYPEGHYVYHVTINGKLLFGHFTVLH